MTTQIKTLFSVPTVTASGLQDILAAAGIDGVVVESVSYGGEIIEVEASRHLTTNEKQAVTQVLLALLVTITDA